MSADRNPPGGDAVAHLLTDPADVMRSARAWDRLPASSGPIGGEAWVRAWLEVFGDEHRLAVALLGDVENPTAVLPLVTSRRRPWIRELMGLRELGEPTDVRAAENAGLEPLLDVIVRQRMPMRLSRLPADSPLLPLLGPRHLGRAVVVRRPVAGTPVIDLDERWCEPEHHFSTRRRADFRSAMRRAEKLGTVRLSIEEPGPDEVGTLFDEMVAVEASGWKTQAGTALASRPRNRDFFLRYCRLAAEQKAIRFAFLRIDDRPVAVQLAIEHDGRFSLLKIGFDEEFARCSPGNLLMLHTIRSAAERGLGFFEFLGSEEPWITLWTEKVRPCFSVVVYPVAPWTAVAAAEMATVLTRRRIRRAVAARRER